MFYPTEKCTRLQHRYLPRQQLKRQQHQGLLSISFFLDCECCVARKNLLHFSPIIHQLQGKPVAVGCLLPCGFSCHFPQVYEDTYRHRDSPSPFLIENSHQNDNTRIYSVLKAADQSHVTKLPATSPAPLTDGSKDRPYPTTRPFLPHAPKRKSDITEVDFRYRFLFSFIWFSLDKNTESDKTEVDFCFSFICFSLGKKQKTIKRNLIFVFRLFLSVWAKNRKR